MLASPPSRNVFVRSEDWDTWGFPAPAVSAVPVSAFAIHLVFVGSHLAGSRHSRRYCQYLYKPPLWIQCKATEYRWQTRSLSRKSSPALALAPKKKKPCEHTARFVNLSMASRLISSLRTRKHAPAGRLDKYRPGMVVEAGWSEYLRLRTRWWIIGSRDDARGLASKCLIDNLQSGWTSSVLKRKWACPLRPSQRLK